MSQVSRRDSSKATGAAGKAKDFLAGNWSLHELIDRLEQGGSCEGRRHPVPQPGEMKLPTTNAVAEMLSVPGGTLRYWRKVGLGPSWVKLEGSIRYVEEDVLENIKRNRRTRSVRAYMEEENAL